MAPYITAKRMGPIFVSYRHHQREWVWERLAPALEAGGVKVIVASSDDAEARGEIWFRRGGRLRALSYRKPLREVLLWMMGLPRGCGFL